VRRGVGVVFLARLAMLALLMLAACNEILGVNERVLYEAGAGEGGASTEAGAGGGGDSGAMARD
jgi:hypothetical protein